MFPIRLAPLFVILGVCFMMVSLHHPRPENPLRFGTALIAVTITGIGDAIFTNMVGGYRGDIPPYFYLIGEVTLFDVSSVAFTALYIYFGWVVIRTVWFEVRGIEYPKTPRFIDAE